MNQQMWKTILLLLASLSLCSLQTSAKPPGSVRSRNEHPLPNLDDTLAVAKSPLEPVTLALTLPGSDVARTNEEPLLTTTGLNENSNLFTSSSSRPTRSEPSDSDEQLASSTTTKAPEETTTTQQTSEPQEDSTERPDWDTSGAKETESVRKEADAATTTSTTTTTTTAALDTTSSESSSSSSITQEPEEATTQSESESTPAPKEVSSTSTPEEQEPTTTTTTTTTATAPKDPEPTTTTEPSTTTTTAEPSTTTATTEPPTTTTSTTPAPEPTTTEAPTTTTTTTVADTTTSSSSSAAENTDLKESDQPKEPEPTTTTSTTTPAPKEVTETEESPTSAQPTSTEPTEVSTSTPSAEREQPVSEPPATTTTSTTTTTTTEVPSPVTSQATSSDSANATTAKLPEESKQRDEDKVSCDHLPTYNSEEIQKVFREETTFKNGTIRGKFTYINFDHRYRLVHYTRLPYGPVKIDKVEELGKPSQSGGPSTSNPATAQPGDVPNAVLQLRNLLPNSLFGFPFLNPNSGGARAQLPFSNSQREGSNMNDDSSMYFYSTDSLSTPNLMNSRVPVSLLPGQRLRNPDTDSRDSATEPRANISRQPAAASAGQSQSSFGMPSQPTPDGYSTQLNRLDESIGRPAAQTRAEPSFSSLSSHRSDQHQFQYSSPFPHLGQQNSEANKGFVYSYSTSHDTHPPAQYQYSAPPPAVYQGAQPLRVHHHSFELHKQHYDNRHQAQSHQPHSHEHYMAPFMFAQPNEQLQSTLVNTDNDNGGSRLKLQVKTSKALNLNQAHGQGTKSAQLRIQPSNGHYSQLISPSRAMHHRQQQRFGKQNHLLHGSSSQTNQSPVVYHVLTNPYNRRQYDQGHAMAYDQDN